MASLHLFMLLPTFYGAGHLKIGQIQTALVQFLSFQLVREKKSQTLLTYLLSLRFFPSQAVGNTGWKIILNV